MRVIVLGMASIIVLYELCKWVMEVAGSPFLQPPKGENEPKTVADLMSEVPRLPKSVYTVFQRGVDLHVAGKHKEALAEYGKLQMIPRSGGKHFDLTDVSETLRYNIRLVKDE
jgi:tripartite-type tricarboxylate transporter receptor subunit TctC